MTGKYIFLTLRKLQKNRLYTLFVVLGLSLGVATLLTTFQWSAWHFSYDKDFPDHELIHRLTFEEIHDGFYRHTARVIHGKALNRVVQSEEISGIDKICRLAPFRNAVVYSGRDYYNESKAFACDPEFLDIFPAEIISGNPNLLLHEPYSTVLTESIAKKLFGDENPVGRSISIMHQRALEATLYEVKAVIRDYPANSHLNISILCSFEDPAEYSGTGWTYTKLFPGVNSDSVAAEVKKFMMDDLSATYVEGLTPRLQELDNIHMHSHKARELQPNIRFRSVLIIGLAGMLIFLLAWFNFTLLSVSQNQLKLDQMHIQWQMGADRKIFFNQFFIENLLVSALSFVAGIITCILLAPLIEQNTGVPLLLNRKVFVLTLALLATLMMASSVLSALQSTRSVFKLVQNRNEKKSGRAVKIKPGQQFFIRMVIILEFIITFILLSNLMMINRQTRFAMDRQMGANIPDVIHMTNLHKEIVDNFESFKARILESPYIDMLTGSMEEPTGQTMDAKPFSVDGVDAREKQLFLFPVDNNFIEFYELELLHGLDFPEYIDKDAPIDYFILNETAAELIDLDPESLINSELEIDFGHEGYIRPGPIRGIVKDFHLSGLDYEISPLVLFPKDIWLFCFSIRPAGDIEPALDHLEKVWLEMFPNYPMDYHFTESLIEQLYEPERDQVKLLILFGILSIIISGLGLFALSGLFMHRKIKSAVVRKVNGARIHQIILPELAYYLWLIIISSAMAVPASYYLMVRWLLNFSYRIEISLWIFVSCALILILCSWLAVLYHSIRLARLNPVKFLRES